MCIFNSNDECETNSDEEPQQVLDEDDQQDYSQMFAQFEAQLVQYRALLMRRLVQDPFYNLMNISPASRIWMLRYLKHLALYAEERYHITLLQFFERMSRQAVFTFLRHKNAPPEMIEHWDKLHPVDAPNAPSPGQEDPPN